MIAILERINQLANKAKEVGLTEIEKTEQMDLRKEYLQIFRGSVQSILLNATIYDPNGDDVTPEKLRREQAKIVKP
ncbi:DUF896 domain-containing protein [Paenibacillus polymyxa]|jgi:uncharacterized protein YnzC (UPF0291/DUF896 family)|uniref:UPF0291 protein NCTC10343_00211 n=1 Tax=Paenibacillus polymyxa TaxID=1406 RepID=A0A0F0G2H9_PAEPO|nr:MULTISPECIES: DUF896 domain-containing protein [Paenibacillus]AHM63915.1 hypothetical protein PPSQR21_002040 [Paenibacillus polymyxa SQR-21]AIY09622.1 hypothetical protein LK13_14015 [Paenibacillus polymyxa]AUS24453.1 hypothetical protein C1A50_0214 [Paenibacillus polymyxa]KAE8559495.1 hypothetical protein BJH92_14085 [Paenibacillus polymyxa]KAF6583743.1 DUF896 domain-containing protein [Paenibacillus sp. EKM211P]